MDKYKTRLVAKGYTQQAGVNFLETFSPVAKLVSVKLILILAVVKGWALCHLDINSAFLYGDLSQEIYMEMPLGLASQGGIPHPQSTSLPNHCMDLGKPLDSGI